MPLAVYETNQVHPMGLLILGSVVLGLFACAPPALIGALVLAKQHRQVRLWQVVSSLLTGVVCVGIYAWKLDFANWMRQIEKLPSSEQAGAFIGLALAFGILPGVALTSAIFALVVLYWLSPNDVGG